MTLHRTTLACLTALAVLNGGPALAQEASGGWRFSATLYAWLPAMDSSLDTDLGTLDSTLSSSDAISGLEFAFMGTATAQRDRWSLIGDLVYSDISTDSPTPGGLLFSKGTADTALTAFSGYAAYRVAETEQGAIDLAAGFRLFSLDLDFTLRGALAETRRFGSSETWVLPVIGARAIFPIADRWTGTLFADVGAVSSDETTWQALARVDYAINSNWSAVLAYRYMDMRKPIDGNDASVELYGPIVGLSYTF
jgi:opacity protein-like surface antigen